MTTTRQNILRTLAYFDIFHYPLSNAEILSFNAEITSQNIIDITLDSLCKENIVFKIGEFYSIQNNISLALRRHKGNKFAIEQMKFAHKAAKILSRFPYVRGLAISGSLSKNYADESTDIDFFIIIAPNRLWFARSVMHLFYKLILFTGRQRWFCMNYYVDEAGLEIEEKNIFTAIEITTLLPMIGKKALDSFMQANNWAKDHFPLFCVETANVAEIKKGIVNRLIEKFFNAAWGNGIDNRLMKITDKRWKKKVERNQKNIKGNALSMIVSKHCSKPDPKNFQDKVIRQFEAKLNTLLQPETISGNV